MNHFDYEKHLTIVDEKKSLNYHLILFQQITSEGDVEVFVCEHYEIGPVYFLRQNLGKDIILSFCVITASLNIFLNLQAVRLCDAYFRIDHLQWNSNTFHGHFS